MNGDKEQQQPIVIHPRLKLALDHPDHPWNERGYRPDLAASPQTTFEDPGGEIAYQRAFQRVAAMNPGRVPCPSFFPNSPTAATYTAWRDTHLFSPRTGATQANYSRHTTTQTTSQPQSLSNGSTSGGPPQQQENLPSPGYNEDLPIPHHRNTITTNGDGHSKTSSGSSTPLLHIVREQQRSPRPIRTMAEQQPRPQPFAHTQDVTMTDVLPMTLEPKFNAAPPGPDKLFR
ncbi:hypothetical protein LTR72_002428 [Exophiala xenobiotica]|nr:hypothetical protein LTR72_002428 [Exophiala xenobiotica]KAK5325696.1 hypothetical protein LTR93_003916 [Exophiala xenobiotica]KAK5407285.1 hypothetical protein LTR06_008027 [Exophiala xenobiotica]KAK5487601.1 hypothetical protein LTR55_004973 [Exophiala xenobiotica]